MKLSVIALILTCLPLLGQGTRRADREISMGIPIVPEVPNRLTISQDRGSFFFDSPGGKISYLGDFNLQTDTGLELSSRNAIYHLNTSTIDLRGNVAIYQSGILQKGDRATYDVKNRNLITKGLRISADPMLLRSGNFESRIDKDGNNYFVGTDASLTTHDVEHPNFWVKADTIKVYPNDRVTFKNLKLVAGKTPIFWLPYFSQPLDAELGYHFIPGAKSSWGAYLLNRYGIMIEDEKNTFLTDANGKPWLLAQYLIDFRTRRGIGTGIDFKDTRLRHNKNLTGLRFYYINDLDPQITRSGIVRSSVNEDRYRAEFKHRFYLNGDPNKTESLSETYVDANLTWHSDRYFREDFEPKLYRVDPSPENSISYLHRTPRFLTGISNKLRINSFYDTETSAPEVFFDYIKSPVFKTPLLYEGHLSVGKYKEYFADHKLDSLNAELATLLPGDPRITEINSLLEKRGFNRFHTWHEFSLPIRPVDGISIVPHAGFGYTKYWDIQNGTTNFDRTHLQAGVDFSMKFSRHYENVVSKKWGIDGLLHIVQPYANYTVLSTDVLDPSFHPIDRLTPSTDVRPIKVGRFSATDQLNDWSILRLGVRNNLLTKRDGGTHPWLTFDTYIDMFIEDPELDREFSNLYNSISWHPLPWVKLNFEAQFPFANSGSGFSEYAYNITYMPNKRTEITLGYRYLNSHPTLEDSSLVDIRAYTRFNDRWGASAFQRWELDDGTLESQQYAIHHDFGSWSSSLGIIRRDNRIKNEVGVMLSFTLKEFPSISLPVSLDTE